MGKGRESEGGEKGGKGQLEVDKKKMELDKVEKRKGEGRKER